MTQLAPAPAPTFRWICLDCRSFNPAHTPSCARCGAGWAVAKPAAGAPRAPRWTRRLPALLELALVAGLFLLWRIVATFGGWDVSGALARGHGLWSFERRLHLPSEAAVQHLVLGHPDLVRGLNVYYLAAHVGGMAAFLVWLYVWHRGAYPRWRNAVAICTGVCLAIAFLPVAPPRLLSGIGLVDTGRVYHESAYGPLAGRLTDALSSMPSVHFVWALLVGIGVVRVSRSHWRYLALLQPAATLFAVVATANHYWLDCVAGAGVACVVLWWRPGTTIALLIKGRGLSNLRLRPMGVREADEGPVPERGAKCPNRTPAPAGSTPH